MNIIELGDMTHEKLAEKLGGVTVDFSKGGSIAHIKVSSVIRALNVTDPHATGTDVNTG